MNIVPYTVYDANGTILRTGTAPESMVSLQALDGEQVIAEMANQLTDFIQNGTVTAKPAIAARIDKTTLQSGGVDVATISGLPQPCTVHIESSSNTVTDGVAQISVNAPGDYSVRISALNYLDWTVSLHAN